MFLSAARVITAIVVGGAGVYYSYQLIAYADRDDSPGGMVIGTVLMFGFVVLGIWIGRRRPSSGPRA